MEHISRVDTLQKGDVLSVEASYNSSAHMLMEAPGTKDLEPIMGISRV